MGGGVESLFAQQSQETLCTVHCFPHARTLRKAREQVKLMVADGASLCQIKNYLSRWGYWWVKTAGIWNYDELASQYISSCWDIRAANLCAFAFQRKTIIGLHCEIQRGAAIAADV